MRKVGLIERLGPRGMYPNERIAVDALSEPGLEDARLVTKGARH
jgi:hypothetical protein